MRFWNILFSFLLFSSALAVENKPLPPENWKGATLDSGVHKVWSQSLCWRHAQSTGLSCSFKQPQDWTMYQAASFWLHSEKATGSKFVLAFTSENPKSLGSDYYSTSVTINWTGWKRIVLPFNELNIAREPLGWNHIGAVRLTASGYGNTPDPAAVLRLDGFELVAGPPTGQRMTDNELFANLDLQPADMAEVRKAVEAGDVSAAKAALAAHFRNRTSPRWLFDWHTPAFRESKAKAGKFAKADKAMQHKFDFSKGPGKKDTLDFGPKIDWTANPTEGEARTHLWNESLNRHFHFRTLAEAYWQSGQDKYAKEIADEILDWTASNPMVLLSSGNRMRNGCEAWQTLTTGIRLADVWPNSIYRVLSSPAFSDNVICTIYKSVCEQARHLVDWPSTGNWLTAESNGLFSAGVLFPEFKEAADWRRIALERLYKQLDDEVYPDGMEYELAGGYNNWVVTEFAHILELADLNGRRGEVPADFLAKMEKMFNYLLFASMPNGRIPGLNDSNNSNIRELLATGFRLFPNRRDFEFVATAGKSGTPPSATSHAFPYSGHYVMRSSWQPDATYMLLDSGPYGYGHQHEDKLHFVLWAHGRQLVLDPGNYSYDRSRWRRYVLSTSGHNTVMVDGLNQNRKEKKETYFWPRPWASATPAENKTVWSSTSDYDYVRGVYSDGYGPANAVNVTHQRQILFVKSENIFVIADTLTPNDEAGHRYDALFHLDSANAVVDAATHAVSTANSTSANVSIIPLRQENLSVDIVKGKDEEPVQGWSSDPRRAIPTAIYRASGKGTVRMVYVLDPTAKDAQPTVRSIEPLSSSTEGLSCRVMLSKGGILEIHNQPQDTITLTRKH